MFMSRAAEPPGYSKELDPIQQKKIKTAKASGDGSGQVVAEGKSPKFSPEPLTRIVGL